MAIVINGSGTLSGLAVGGLPDGTVDAGTLATNSVDSAELIDGAVDTSHFANDVVSLAKMAHSTDGELISFDANGAPVYVATGNDGQVLTSTGAGSPPVFEALPASGKLVKSTIAYSNNTRQVFSMSQGVAITSENFRTPSGGYHYFTCSKTSASSTLVFHLSLNIDGGQQQHLFGLWRTSGASSSNSGVTNFTRLSYDHDRAIGSATGNSLVLGGMVTMASLGTGTHHFWFSFGRSNDGNNVKYTLNPDTNDAADKSGATTSTIVINEIEI